MFVGGLCHLFGVLVLRVHHIPRAVAVAIIMTPLRGCFIDYHRVVAVDTKMPPR